MVGYPGARSLDADVSLCRRAAVADARKSSFESEHNGSTHKSSDKFKCVHHKSHD